jgi:GWxTD domain-containing protein
MRVQEFESPKAQMPGWLEILLGLGLLFGLTSAAMQLSVDYATFRSASPDSETVEIYHSLPYEQLHYRNFADTLHAAYLVKVRLTSLETGTAITESVYEQAIIPPKFSPAARKLSVANSFSVNLAPGHYRMEMEIRDTLDQGSRVETLTVRDLRHVPSVSDPIIGASVVQARSGLISVVPMANRTFGPSGLHEMYVYVNGYDFAASLRKSEKPTNSETPAPETLYHELTIVIMDSTGAVVKTLPTERRKRTDSQISEIFGLSSQGLAAGTYRLHVTLRDLVTDSVAGSEKDFYVTGPAAATKRLDTLSMTAEERKAFTDIRYLATARELKEFNTLNREGKFEWLRMQFWPRHDFDLYYRRLQVADDRFKFGRKLGRDTDRGRIYLRYGEPDEIETHAMVEQTKSHEHWRYYRLGYHFIFVDVGGDGRLRLVYSNTQAEPKVPNWENLVDPLELPDLQEK